MADVRNNSNKDISFSELARGAAAQRQIFWTRLIYRTCLAVIIIDLLVFLFTKVHGVFSGAISVQSESLFRSFSYVNPEVTNPVTSRILYNIWDYFSSEPGRAGLVTAFSAAVYARLSVRASVKKATLDLIDKSEQQYGDIFHALSAYRNPVNNSGDGPNEILELLYPSKCTDPEKREKLKEVRKKVIELCNHYELIAIGIREKALSESFYKKWMGAPLVRDWILLEPFVQNERFALKETGLEEPGEVSSFSNWHYREDLYKNFNLLAYAWRKLRSEYEERVIILKENSYETAPAHTLGIGYSPTVIIPSRKMYSEAAQDDVSED